MSDQLDDGRYEVKALNTVSLLTEMNGAIVTVSSWGTPAASQIWQLTNMQDGTVALRCEQSSRYLSMNDRDGLYYLSSEEATVWRIEPNAKGGGYDIALAATGRRIWLSGLLLDPRPAFLQGVDQDVIPTRWAFTAL